MFSLEVAQEQALSLFLWRKRKDCVSHHQKNEIDEIYFPDSHFAEMIHERKRHHRISAKCIIIEEK